MRRSMIQKFRRLLGSVTAATATLVLVAPATMAGPTRPGGVTGGTVRTTIQEPAGTSDLVLVGLGAAITLALLVAIRFSVTGIRRYRTAHA